MKSPRSQRLFSGLQGKWTTIGDKSLDDHQEATILEEHSAQSVEMPKIIFEL